MSPDRPVTDEVFTARLGLGLRELDGSEEAPDVSSTVANRLANDAPDHERARIRHWPLLAALLAVFVIAALWLQHRAGPAPSNDTPAVAQDPQPPTAQQVLTYAHEPPESGRAPSGEATAAALQKRLSDLASVRLHDGQLLVTTATGDQDPVRSLIESDARLELRPVATADYAADGIRFELDAECKRLQAWLEAGGRDRLRSDLGAIRDYRGAGAGLRWVTRVIPRQADAPERWDFRLIDLPTMAPATVAAHTDADWNGGLVPPHGLALPLSQRGLIELVAINTHAEFLDQSELDPDSFRKLSDNEPSQLLFATRPEAAPQWPEFSERHLRKHLAIVWNGELLTVPMFVSRLPTNTATVGCGTSARADTMLRMLGSPLPVRLHFLGAKPAQQ